MRKNYGTGKKIIHERFWELPKKDKHAFASTHDHNVEIKLSQLMTEVKAQKESSYWLQLKVASKSCD